MRAAIAAPLSVTLRTSGDGRLRVVGYRASNAQAVLDSVEVHVSVTP